MYFAAILLCCSVVALYWTSCGGTLPPAAQRGDSPLTTHPWVIFFFFFTGKHLFTWLLHALMHALLVTICAKRMCSLLRLIKRRIITCKWCFPVFIILSG